MRQLIALLMAVLVTGAPISVAAASDNEPAHRKALSSALSKRTVALLREGLWISSVVSSQLTPGPFGGSPCIAPDVPGAPTHLEEGDQAGIRVHETEAYHRKEWEQPGEARITVAETSLESGRYNGMIGEHVFGGDKVVSLVKMDNVGRILGVSIQAGTMEINYVATGATVSGRVAWESKEFAQPGKGKVNVPETGLEPGTYAAFNARQSAVMLDRAGGLLAVVVGDSTRCDPYLAAKAQVTGSLTQWRTVGYMDHVLSRSTVSLADTVLKEGSYQAFHGPDAAFILDKGDIAAVVVRQDAGCVLYIGTDATCDFYLWKPYDETWETSSADLQPGIHFKALVGPYLGLILDIQGNPHWFYLP